MFFFFKLEEFLKVVIWQLSLETLRSLLVPSLSTISRSGSTPTSAAVQVGHVINNR